MGQDENASHIRHEAEVWLCLMRLHELFPHSNHQQILKHSPRYAKSITQAYRALRWQETINPRLHPIMSNTSKVLKVKPGLVQNIIFIHSFTSHFALCVIALWSRKCACHQLASRHYKCSCLSLSCCKLSGRFVCGRTAFQRFVFTLLTETCLRPQKDWTIQNHNSNMWEFCFRG